MRSKSRIPLLVFTLLALAGLVLTTSLRSWGQSDPTSVSQKTKDEDHIPITDYDASILDETTASSAQARALRRDTGKRYDTGVKGVIKDRDTGGRPVLTFSDWDTRLPAIPAAKSDVVALGEVINSQAYLSDDKTGVYSEFTVRVEEILKDNNVTSILPGSLIVTERRGGRVKFPSGRVLRYGVAGQGLPRNGRRYAFFLERNDQQYFILTAYELQSGQIHPLDGASALGGGRWAGDSYQGVDATQFLNEVRGIVAKSTRIAHDEGAVKP